MASVDKGNLSLASPPQQAHLREGWNMPELSIKLCMYWSRTWRERKMEDEDGRNGS